MNIKETFLALTKKTYPHGHEFRLRNYLPKGNCKDKHGNYYYVIGESKTIFACHLDTVSMYHGPVKHVIEGNIIKTDGKTILGADDKAGVCVLLYLISQNIPGTYYFFIGEEVGCIGSKAAVLKDDFSDYDRIISFDRRDVCSIITHQSMRRTCSEEFADALSKQYIDLGLELKPDDTGVHTDSDEFKEVISECTNISVGYYDEHHFTERQDIDFLEKLCMASAIIDWESLPTKRDKSAKEWKDYDYQPTHLHWRDRERAQRWNNPHRGGGWNTRDRWETDKWDEPITYDRRAFGYHDDYFDDEEESEYPMDTGNELDLRNNRSSKKKKSPKYGPKYDQSIEDYLNETKENRDIFSTFREFLSDDNLTLEDYKLIDEQYIETWIL